MFAAVGVGGVVYGARTWMPELASRHGAGIDAMLHYLLVTVGALFLAGYVALAYFIWRGSAPRIDRTPLRHAAGRSSSLSVALGLGMADHRRRRRARDRHAGLGRVLRCRRPRPTPSTIEVTAQQFMWNVRYPGPDGMFGRTDADARSTTRPIPLGLDRTDPAGKDDIVTLNEITRAGRTARSASGCTRRTSSTASSCRTSG